MDEHQRQIQSGAGLQESRLNQDFVDFLKSWGTYILYGVVVIVGLYAAFLWWTRSQAAAHDEAFAAYARVADTGSPEDLLGVASQYAGRGSIWELATLDAAEQMLDAARIGVRPGASDETLDEAGRLQVYEAARERLEEVLDRTRGVEAKQLFAQQARWGIATAAIGMGELDAAREQLERYIEVAESTGFEADAERARARLALLDELAEPVAVYAEADLPEEARPSAITASEADLLRGATGSLPPGMEITEPPSALQLDPGLGLPGQTPEPAEPAPGTSVLQIEEEAPAEPAADEPPAEEPAPPAGEPETPGR